MQNLGAICFKRLFCSETKLEGNTSSGSAVFVQSVLELSATLGQDVIAGSRRARNLVCTPYLDFGGN